MDDDRGIGNGMEDHLKEQEEQARRLKELFGLADEIGQAGLTDVAVFYASGEHHEDPNDHLLLRPFAASHNQLVEAAARAYEMHQKEEKEPILCIFLFPGPLSSMIKLVMNNYCLSFIEEQDSMFFV